MTGELFELAAQPRIGLHVLARERRDLQEVHLAAVLGIVLEQPLERHEALGDALGIVEAVDADDLLAIVQVVAELRVAALRFRRRRERGEALRVDADREDVGAEPAAAGFDPAAFKLLSAELAA